MLPTDPSWSNSWNGSQQKPHIYFRALLIFQFHLFVGLCPYKVPLLRIMAFTCQWLMLVIKWIIVFTFLLSVGQADEVPGLQTPWLGGFLTVRPFSVLNLLIDELPQICIIVLGVKALVFLTDK